MLSGMNRIRLFSLPAIAALASALGACAVPPDQGHVVDGVVMVAPPAPQVDIIPPPPQPSYLWIGGYWNWVGGRYSWVPGHWTAPRPGHRWVPHEWVRQGDGWRLRPGHWQRADSAP